MVALSCKVVRESESRSTVKGGGGSGRFMFIEMLEIVNENFIKRLCQSTSMKDDFYHTTFLKPSNLNFPAIVFYVKNKKLGLKIFISYSKKESTTLHPVLIT